MTVGQKSYVDSFVNGAIHYWPIIVVLFLAIIAFTRIQEAVASQEARITALEARLIKIDAIELRVAKIDTNVEWLMRR
jgi:hypothetical protein